MIVPVHQGHISRKLDRLKAKWCDIVVEACTAKHCGQFVVKIVEGGGGVAEQILFATTGEDLDGIHLQTVGAPQSAT